MAFLWVWLYAWLALGQSTPSADTLVRRAAVDGTPLIDTIENDQRYAQLTFVWRGTSETRNIAVVGTFMKEPLMAMTRIEGSDIWYLTTRVPAGARFAYWLAENTPMVTEGPRVPEMLAALQADPLNPHRTCAADAPLRGCKSNVEMPGAPEQPWSVKHPETPAGAIEKFRLRSERLKNERDLFVYTPAGYRSDGRAPALLILFEGRSYIDVVPTPVILDNLTAASHIPPVVGIFVDNPDQAPACSKSIRRGRVGTSSRPVVTCAMFCWPRDMKFTTSNSTAAMTISAGAVRLQTD
jgi:Domain of unknown function (DUF3327)/Putative esterase